MCIFQILVVYNFSCSLLSLYTLYGFSRELIADGNFYSTRNNPALESYFKLYWILKNVELLDTVFMILRHRRRQISFLHVFHHSTMVMLSDFAYHLFQWPCIAVFLVLNSFVHVVLYSYYGLAAYNPKSPPQWKKQVTEIQILQFFIDMVFAIYGFFYHNFCIYSLSYGAVMIYFFCDFYNRAYLKSKPKQNGYHQNQKLQ